MARVLIGKGTTNAQGIATMTEDASGQSVSGYTGVGAGEIDIVAECGTVVSEPSTVLDCVEYDTGIDGTATDIYETRDANSLLTRTSEYSKLTEQNTNDALLRLNLTAPITVEFDYKRVDGLATDSLINLYDSNSYKTFFSLEGIRGSVGQWYNLRLTIEENTATLTNLEDATKTKTNTYSGTPNNVRWYTSNTCSEIQIRNVKVYPL